MVMGLSKNVATMVGWRGNILKLYWLKLPKTVPKNEIWTRNKWFKTSSLKFIFSFQIFEQKVSKPTKTSKKDHPFCNAVLPKKPYSFCEPQLTQLSKNILPAAHPKTLQALQTFQQICFWLVSEKKHLHCTISRRPRTAFSKHLESKCLYIKKQPPQVFWKKRCS